MVYPVKSARRKAIEEHLTGGECSLVRSHNAGFEVWAIACPKTMRRFTLTDGTYCLSWAHTLIDLANLLGIEGDGPGWVETHCIVFEPTKGVKQFYRVMLREDAGYTVSEWVDSRDPAWKLIEGVWLHRGLKTPYDVDGRLEISPAEKTITKLTAKSNLSS